MKKPIFLAAALLLVSFAQAQFNLGVKLGYNSSLSMKNISSAGTKDYDMTNVKSEFANGFQLGAFARFGERIYLQPEFLYEMGKREYEVTLNDVNNQKIRYDELVTISTIDIPVLVGYKLIDAEYFNLRAFAGPKLRLDAGSKLNYQNLEPGSSVSLNDLKGELKRAKVGLEAGVGVDFFMLTLDARFNVIGDMYETQLNSIKIDNVPNNTFVISLGWKFF